MTIAELTALLSPDAHHATDWFRGRDEEPRLISESGYPAEAANAARAAGHMRVHESDLELWQQIIRRQLGTRAPELR